jgi:molybdate transport system ATP-binding protein
MAELNLAVELELGAFRLKLDESLPVDGITVIFGPSGSGKTSLLRVVAGLETRARGRVSFGADKWQDSHALVPAHRRRLGYVFQDGRLFPHLTVAGNLRFARQADRAAPQFDDVVAALDLAPLLERRPASLSGGEQQRVAIGRALLASPQLLLMDEPLSSLDIERKREVIGYIERLRAAFGLPILYVTHNIGEVIRLADHMLLLAAGRAAAQGSVAALLDRIDLAPLIGEADAGSLVVARVSGQRDGMTALDLEGETLLAPVLEIPAGRTVRLRIHARDVVLATERPRKLSIRNVLAARVERIDADESAYADVTLRVGAQLLRARVTKHALEELGLANEQTVFALIKAVAFDEEEYLLLGGTPSSQ